MQKLTFGLGNAKLNQNITTFSLPAGHTCPFARECLSKVNPFTNRITDGKYCKYRCYAASEEVAFPSVKKSRWTNFNLIRSYKSIANIANLIQYSLPIDMGIIRCHTSGDFFSEAYFLAWLNIAIDNPQLTIYGYTKAVPFLVRYKKDIPSNFRLTVSKGGTHDALISKHRLRYAEVFFSPEEAHKRNMPIDHNDYHAIYGKTNFGLILHGCQPKGSPASIALSKLKKNGLGFYNEETKANYRNKVVHISINLKRNQLVLPQKIRYYPIPMTLLTIGKFPFAFTHKSISIEKCS